MISFEGETGPYLQYTHARICSLLRKGGSIKTDNSFNRGELDSEWALIVKLSGFPEVIHQAFDEHNPSKLTRYLLQLAQLFNKYYAHVRILEKSEGIEGRLALVKSVQTVLKEGLRLLGMKAPVEM
jgi:arginyl-tRNA synthetase